MPALSVDRNSSLCTPSPETDSGLAYGTNPAPSRLNSVLSAPESASVAASLIWTGVWFHPLALAGGFAVATLSGGVLSMLISLSFAFAVFPARSEADPITAWLAPSLASTTSLEQTAILENASLQSKCTVTSLLFQP